MYEVHLNFSDDKLHKYGVSCNRPFHFESAVDVCDLIKVLPSKVFISLYVYSCDSIDDVLKIFKDT